MISGYDWPRMHKNAIHGEAIIARRSKSINTMMEKIVLANSIFMLANDKEVAVPRH